MTKFDDILQKVQELYRFLILRLIDKYAVNKVHGHM
jgi:hypothetical protein